MRSFTYLLVGMGLLAISPGSSFAQLLQLNPLNPQPQRLNLDAISPSSNSFYWTSRLEFDWQRGQWVSRVQPTLSNPYWSPGSFGGPPRPTSSNPLWTWDLFDQTPRPTSSNPSWTFDSFGGIPRPKLSGPDPFAPNPFDPWARPNSFRLFP